MERTRTIWKPLILGSALGLLAGLSTVAGLSFITPGITDNAIGIYVTFLLLAAALGGPLAGIISSVLFVTITTLFGPPDMKEILSDPIVFWPNLLSLAASVALVAIAYRLIFNRLEKPARLLAWAGIVIGYYAIQIPSSVIPQYLLDGSPKSEILPAVVSVYEVFYPQAIFDIFITILIFIALPASFTRPLWYEPKGAAEPANGSKTTA